MRVAIDDCKDGMENTNVGVGDPHVGRRNTNLQLDTHVMGWVPDHLRW